MGKDKDSLFDKIITKPIKALDEKVLKPITDALEDMTKKK